MKANHMDIVSEITQTAAYTIRLNSIIDPSWLDWFDGFSIILQINGTALIGLITDQSGLRSILTMIAESNLPIVSVNQFPRENLAETILFHGMEV